MVDELKPPQANVEGLSPGMKDEEVLDVVLSKEEIIPWEPATLPSRGAYYEGKIPNGVVKVRPMGIFADKILATARLAKSGKSLDWLFRKCVQLPDGMDPLDLLIGDRIYLLYYLRGITHGNDYEFVVTCTNTDCGKTSNQQYNLNELVRTVIPPNADLGPEPFKCVLPYLSEVTDREFWVKVRLLRGKDTQDMLTKRNFATMHPRAARAKSETQQRSFAAMSETVDETVSQNLNLVISEVMGSTDRMKIQAFVEKLHAKDTATIREFLKDNSPGIDTQIVINCPHCDNEMTVDLPITESFFRPTKH